MKKKFKSRTITRMWNRINRRNKNLIVAFLGETGSGKSWASLRLAEQLDKDFGINRVVFTPAQFMELLNNKRKYGLKKGSIIMWDEAGVGYGSRDFFKEANKNIGKVLQTFRHQNLGLFVTVPHKDFVDKQGRTLLHYTVEMVGLDRDNKQTLAKVKQAQMNPMYKTYHKYQRKVGENGLGVLKYVRINKPSKKIIDAYEKKKEGFTAQLNKNIEKEFKTSEQKYKNKYFDIDQAINYVQSNIDDFTKKWRGKDRVDKHLIALHFNIGDTLARRVTSGVKKSIA